MYTIKVSVPEQEPIELDIPDDASSYEGITEFVAKRYSLVPDTVRFMVTDFGDIPEWIEEMWDAENYDGFFEWIVLIDTGEDEDVCEAAYKLDIDVSNVCEAYQGEYRSDEDFVENLLTDCGDLPTLPHYIFIDWERTAECVMQDYCEHNNHYFRYL